MQINNLVYMYSLPQITFCFARIIYVITYSHWMVITSYMPSYMPSNICHKQKGYSSYLQMQYTGAQNHTQELFPERQCHRQTTLRPHGFSKGPRGEQIFLLYAATTLWRSPLTTTPIHAAPWSLKIVPFTLTLYPRAFAGGFLINGAGVTWAS